MKPGRGSDRPELQIDGPLIIVDRMSGAAVAEQTRVRHLAVRGEGEVRAEVHRVLGMGDLGPRASLQQVRGRIDLGLEVIGVLPGRHI